MHPQRLLDVSPLPADATLLPVRVGHLLVSRSHAVFCRVESADVALAKAILAGSAPLAALPSGLVGELDRHGFFGPPRPAAR
jgi:hypothetical protein